MTEPAVEQGPRGIARQQALEDSAQSTGSSACRGHRPTLPRGRRRFGSRRGACRPRQTGHQNVREATATLGRWGDGTIIAPSRRAPPSAFASPPPFPDGLAGKQAQQGHHPGWLPPPEGACGLGEARDPTATSVNGQCDRIAPCTTLGCASTAQEVDQRATWARACSGRTDSAGIPMRFLECGSLSALIRFWEGGTMPTAYSSELRGYG